MIGNHMSLKFVVYLKLILARIGLRNEVIRFLKYMLALMLLNFSVGSLSLAIGAAVGKFSIANPIFVMILVISLVKILWFINDS